MAPVVEPYSAARRTASSYEPETSHDAGAVGLHRGDPRGTGLDDPPVSPPHPPCDEDRARHTVARRHTRHRASVVPGRRAHQPRCTGPISTSRPCVPRRNRHRTDGPRTDTHDLECVKSNRPLSSLTDTRRPERHRQRGQVAKRRRRELRVGGVKRLHGAIDVVGEQSAVACASCGDRDSESHALPLSRPTSASCFVLPVPSSSEKLEAGLPAVARSQTGRPAFAKATAGSLRGHS